MERERMRMEYQLAFNRTSLELKPCGMGLKFARVEELLIAPVWN